MERTLTIASAKDMTRNGRVALSETPLCLTPGVLDDILRTVGARRPESGAKLFGPADKLGTDLVEFDVPGSARASGTVYAPDVEWGTERVHFHLAQEGSRMRVWHGDLHSHPGENGFPSRAVGPGLGDLGYAAEVLTTNPWMEDFFFPILTGAGTPTCTLWPWVMTRQDHGQVRSAVVVIDVPARYPARRYNPDWEASVGGQTPKTTPALVTHSVPLIPLDLDEVAILVGLPLTSGMYGWRFTRREVAVELSFPSSFPTVPPTVTVVTPSDLVLPFGFRWATRRRERVEYRLARLIRAALSATNKEY